MQPYVTPDKSSVCGKLTSGVRWPSQLMSQNTTSSTLQQQYTPTPEIGKSGATPHLHSCHIQHDNVRRFTFQSSLVNAN
jgi:hypothetical protein